jgi:hypothetical protein
MKQNLSRQVKRAAFFVSAKRLWEAKELTSVMFAVSTQSLSKRSALYDTIGIRPEGRSERVRIVS